MNILVCVKRVPDVGARIEIGAEGKRIETKNLGFTISPHEECAVEEAVQIVERLTGTGVVLTLGPGSAEEQLRDSLARGMDSGILLESEEEWDPAQTAAAIVEAIQKSERGGKQFDLIMFGNESADAGDYQVGIRVAHALDRPCVTGVKGLEVQGSKIAAKREGPLGLEIYEVGLPAVITVKEGLNLPRHPSLRGTMTAKKKPIERSKPAPGPVGLELTRLRLPPEKGGGAEILGQGTEAIPKIMKVLEEAGFK
jgi:electron transfer flavoprotein beta subunit